MQLLLDTANKTVREDGWVLLSTALSQIEQSLTEEFALVKEKYGHESLKALLLDSELFDITEKSDDKNNI